MADTRRTGASRNGDRAKRRLTTYVLFSLTLLVLFSLVRDSAWQGSAELHTVMEVAATLLAAAVGSLALVRYYARKTTTFLFIGSGFLGTAFLDGYHAVVTSSLFAMHFPSGLALLIPWSWIASRLFLSVLLWMSWVAWRREERFGPAARVSEATVYSWVAVMTLASFLFFAFVPLPRAYFPELALHRPEELVPALFFLLALIGYLRRGRWRTDTFEHWLVLSLIVGVIGQAAFMSFSHRLFDTMFDAAHLLKKVSYILVLSGLMISMYFLFRRVGDAEAHLRAVIDSTVDGIIVIDAERTIEAFNPAAERIFGYASDEVIGSNVKVLVPDPYHQHHDTYVQNYLDTGERKIIGIGREVEGRRKDGSTFPMDLAVSEMATDGRRAFVGITRDITEREEAAEALRLRTAQMTLLHAAAAAANEARSVDDAIQVCLDLVCAHTGWPVGHAYRQAANSEGTLVPTGIWHLEDGERFAVFREVTERTKFEAGIGLPGRVLTSGEPVWIPDVSKDPNFPRAKLAGELGVRAAFGLPVSVGSEVVAVLEFFSPHVLETDEALLQVLVNIGTQLGRVIERRQVETMKNEFISTVSHELRTPLTSIQGSLAIIEKTRGDALPEKFAKLIGIAHKNCVRLVRLINDILDIEKIESGKMAFNRVSQEIMPLVRQAIEANQAFAGEFSVTLALEQERPDAYVTVDGDRIQQVLTNLLSNAAKFSPAGATVEVSVGRRGDNIRVEVADCGDGIPEKFREGIFGRFCQADASSTRKREGTGLGLSIAKAIIEKHGGQIGFETETGTGTTFFFEVPESRGQETSAATAGLRVLICEDDRDVAALLRMMLEREGFACDIAYTAADAREMLSNGDYALMTLDLILPDTDGLSLIHELRSRQETRDLPIVVVSVRAEAGRKEFNGDAVGIQDWLPKPIDQDRLLGAVSRSVFRSRLGSPRILHVEDDADVVTLTATILGEAVEIDAVENVAEARRRLQRESYDLVLLDVALPDGNGLDLIPDLRDGAGKSIPVILFTAHDVSGNVAREVEAVLIKSRTSESQLMETLASVIGGAQERKT